MQGWGITAPSPLKWHLSSNNPTKKKFRAPNAAIHRLKKKKKKAFPFTLKAVFSFRKAVCACTHVK